MTSETEKREWELAYGKEIRQIAGSGPWLPDWDSLAARKSPWWFTEAKFGIFIHWGLYSIAAHGNEWYSRNMYIRQKEEWSYHRKTYGAHNRFGYKDFIPLFTAENFDAGEWVDLFVRAGARYCLPVAEHHDGFQMYRSKLSRWNCWDMGPRRDILMEWKQAAETAGLVFGASSHRAEHWFFMGHGKEFDSDVKEPMERGDFYWPAGKEPEDHMDFFSRPYPSEEFVEDWILRTCELVESYHPSLLYFDWWVQHEAFKEAIKLVAAYYYNQAEKWDKRVSVCYKHDAMAFGSGIPEMERGAFAQAVPFVWQSDTSVASNSWCYTDSLDYKTVRQILLQLIQVVCRNGNLLLNVAPRGDGSIPDKEREILEGIGKWMEINGEAVYGSHPWRIAGEGTTAERQGQFTDGDEIAYTKEDMRFTARGGNIYAFVLSWPEDGVVCIRSLAARGEGKERMEPVFAGFIRNVGILGVKEEIQWRQDSCGLWVFAKQVKSVLPVVVRVRI